MSNNLESNSSSSSAAAANWSNDEVLALLRIRSSLDNWFPESTWAHVSRKLEEVGYKRSAEKCKEKFEEEESRQEFVVDIVKKMMVQQEEMHEKLVEDMVKRDEEKFAREEAWKKVEMDKINKQLEIRAHEQAIVSDRQATLIKFLKSFTTTTTASSSTSSSSGTSNGTTSNNSDHHHHHQNRRSSEESPVDKVPIIAQNNPNDHQVQNPSSNLDDDHHHPNPKLHTSQNPNSDPTQMIKKSPLSPPTITTTNTSAVVVSTQTTALILSNDDHNDTGKRWPRDEVFALINMRCSLHNNNGDQQDKEGQANKIPLWERISQGMSQLGYKRSSKRCKEKWENINKYFRKTKDNVNKKRSLDSRTCPYFHQLSTLYNQGKLVVPPSSNEGAAGNIPATFPENLPAPAGSNSQAGSSSTDSTAIHVDDHHDQAQGEKILVQVPTFDFEF
ncbi:hypothetical protein EZV62_007176 [Acer yangbiense]|uniref:Myb-like domain-containing protein n=1 Tax=Acer yangbiense TaxID=1000413 RepID=A0A5C7I9Y9_9ROSI|nr:hypothetical protein EZV62_007176 [Acer yangbiense]